MRENVKVVRIEAHPEKVAIEKVDKSHLHHRAGFRAATILVLEDGRRAVHIFFRERKRDVAAYLAKLPCAPEHPMTAMLENGLLIGTEISYDLRGGR